MSNWGVNDYQIGAIGHELQEKVDGRLYAQMQEQGDKIDELSTRIHQLNRMITELEHQRNPDNPDSVDLSQLEELVEEFRSLYDEFKKEFPLLSNEECPFPPGLDLANVDSKQLDKVESTIESMKMRYQNKIPIIMEKLNTASALYRILSEICPEIARAAREEKNHSIRRQVQG